MRFREKGLNERVFRQSVALSGLACGADWRKSARLFAYGPRVHFREGLTAGGSEIRTPGPAVKERLSGRDTRGLKALELPQSPRGTKGSHLAPWLFEGPLS